MNSLYDAEVESALRGEKLFGDDFNAEEVEQWFADEARGYSELSHADAQLPIYAYGALDSKYFWPFTPVPSPTALGLGSAYGLEFAAIATRLRAVHILEPAKRYWSDSVAGVPARYIEPLPSGVIPFPDESFDLVVAFGVLHHVPNVSFVLGEISRVLAPRGVVAVREPLVSMGDWRKPRPGLTARERGLPLKVFRGMVERAGLSIRHEAVIGFGPLLHVASRIGLSLPWNSRAFVVFDRVLSRLTCWNYTYHRTSFFRRFAPTIGCFVLDKPEKR
jgi:SAM-dependent methyltransferase